MRRVWFLNALIAAAAAIAFLAGPARLEALAAPIEVPWPLIAAAIFASERLAVHVHLRGETHAVSLGDIPIVFGLFFTDPAYLVLAVLVGDLVALGLFARQPPVKLAFNLACFVLQVSLATIIFGALAGPGAAIGPQGWLAAGAAVVGSTALGAMLVQVAMSLVEGRIDPRELGWVLAFGISVALTNVALALAGVVAVWHEPIAALLLVVPAIALVTAYRAFRRERRARKNSEALAQATRAVRDAPDTEAAIIALMQHARTASRAGRAELILLSEERGGALHASLLWQRPVERPRSVDPAADTIARLLTRPALERVTRLPAEDDEEGRRLLAAEGIERAIAAPIVESGEFRGAILLADPVNEVEGFRGADLELLELLVAHAGAALELDRLGQSLAELSRLERELSHRALHDDLTGLSNRTLFADRVQHALDRRSGAPLAVLFVDLDDFKSVNDTRGHSAGDELLVWVAGQLRTCLRPSDTAARLGGDEFGILLEDLRDPDEAKGVAARIREALRDTDRRRFSRASIGIAMGRTGGANAETLLRNADLAMYAAKRRGKDGCAVFEASMYDEALARYGFEADLPAAIDRDELVLEYQPIVALDSGRVHGHEALIRWLHPDRGRLLPAEFLPVAESCGAMPDLLEWTLGRALADAVRDPMLDRGFVSINVASSQLEHPGFLASIRSALEASQVDPSKVVLEIVETQLSGSLSSVSEKLAVVRELGIRIAIDDFGTGHSSLEHLSQLPVDIIKLPRSLTRNVAAQPRQAALVRAVQAIAEALDLTVVAEGVEYEAESAALTSLGVVYGQGFLLGRPAPRPAVPRLAAVG